MPSNKNLLSKIMRIFQNFSKKSNKDVTFKQLNLLESVKRGYIRAFLVKTVLKNLVPFKTYFKKVILFLIP